MFTYNFKHELKILLRSKWLLILFLTTLITFLYAGYNGKKKTDKRISDIEKINNIVKSLAMRVYIVYSHGYPQNSLNNQVACG